MDKQKKIREKDLEKVHVVESAKNIRRRKDSLLICQAKVSNTTPKQIRTINYEPYYQLPHK